MCNRNKTRLIKYLTFRHTGETTGALTGAARVAHSEEVPCLFLSVLEFLTNMVLVRNLIKYSGMHSSSRCSYMPLVGLAWGVFTA